MTTCYDAGASPSSTKQKERERRDNPGIYPSPFSTGLPARGRSSMAGGLRY